MKRFNFDSKISSVWENTLKLNTNRYDANTHSSEMEKTFYAQINLNDCAIVSDTIAFYFLAVAW